MLKSQKIHLEQSEKRQRINELLGQDDITDEHRNELDSLTKRMQQIEVELRAAIVAEAADAERMATEFANAGLDAETRERLELRSKATVTGYVLAAMQGRLPSGPEAELAAAAGVEGIPL